MSISMEVVPVGEVVERQVLVELPSSERVTGEARRKPKTVDRLKDWQYIERSLHRMIAGWGRNFCEWEDMVACHRHVWEASECVRRLRERLSQFPGSAAHLDAPVSKRLETLVNTALLAPSFEDALDGIYQILTGALTKSYLFYGASAHPVHDAPTIATLHEIVGLKNQARLWLRDYRRRHPHTIDADYKTALERELVNCGDLMEALPMEGEGAAPVGVNTQFRQAKYPGRPAGSVRQHNFAPFIAPDFPRSIETRRLFWCYGYQLEMNLAVQQLRWIYDGHFMPWEFLQDISRHTWDESRHGDSGHSRLLDFGITISDIGFEPAHDGLANARPDILSFPRDAVIPALGEVEPMTPEDLYKAVFDIGMVAETAHFTVKRQAYDDFLAGGDLESAEMMLFDIIDETTHVQYAHKWLPLLAEYAGADNSDYKERGVRIRQEKQDAHNRSLLEKAKLPRDPHDPNFAKYQELLAIMRAKQPLTNAQTCALRDPLPM